MPALIMEINNSYSQRLATSHGWLAAVAPIYGVNRHPAHTEAGTVKPAIAQSGIATVRSRGYNIGQSKTPMRPTRGFHKLIPTQVELRPEGFQTEVRKKHKNTCQKHM